MSSFTAPLVVSPLPDGALWQVARTLPYHLGTEGSRFRVVVPKGYVTNFDSTPWAVRVLALLAFRKDVFGQGRNAYVLHDYLYTAQLFTRHLSDAIFLEALGVLGVSWPVRTAMYAAVRLFGWGAWKRSRG